MTALESLASFQRVQEVAIYRDLEDMQGFVCAVRLYDSRSWVRRLFDPSYPSFGHGDTPEAAIAQAMMLVRYRLSYTQLT